MTNFDIEMREMIGKNLDSIHIAYESTVSHLAESRNHSNGCAQKTNIMFTIENSSFKFDYYSGEKEQFQSNNYFRDNDTNQSQSNATGYIIGTAVLIGLQFLALIKKNF
jgi:hypothetical protein